MGLNNANQPNKNRSEEFESKGSALLLIYNRMNESC